MFKALTDVSKTSAGLISSYLRNFCQTSTNPHKHHLQQIHSGILEPSLRRGSHYALNDQERVQTVQVAYHDCPRTSITDYFSAIGYVLVHGSPKTRTLNFTQLLQLLSQYAEWCRTSSRILKVNPPTVVQMLWTLSDQFYFGPRMTSSEGSFSFASSVAAGKGDGRDDIREERIKVLEAVWSHPLVYPTPVQQEHANSDSLKAVDPSAELFGTPWGHCGESVSFVSMHKTIHAGVSMGTLALGVKAMTSAIPGTGIIPVQVIPNLHHASDIIEILRISGALRPMCLNCQYLNNVASGRIVDFAHRFSDSSAIRTRLGI